MGVSSRSRLRFLPVFVPILVTMAGPVYALNCVEYARKTSGLNISGDAWQWWGGANGHYARGHAPQPNAIMVFDRTPSMDHGHVAVVSKIMNDRLITINHANWAHARSMKGQVSTGVMVQDISEKNDWTEVKVWDEGSRSFGRGNRILGFVYNAHAPAIDTADKIAENVSEPQGEGRHGSQPVQDIDNE